MKPANPQSAIRRSTPLTALSLSKGNPQLKGFTLLEVLLAVSLVIMLSGGIYAFYGYTLGSREQIDTESQTIFAQRRVMDLLAGEILSARTNMQCAGDEVSFMRTAVPGKAVFETQNITESPSIASDKTGPSPFGPQHDIQFISYRLNHYDDENGVEQIGGLERTCLKNIKAKVVVEGEDVEVMFLTEHVKFIRLQYWDGSEWQDSSSSTNLPQAIRISLGTKPLPDDTAVEDYPFETVSRVVAIPAGASQAQNKRGGRR